MQGVGLLGVLLSAVDNNATERDGDIVLRVDHLGDGNGGRDRHDGCGDERGGGNTERDVAGEDRARDGREAGGHGEVELGRRRRASQRAGLDGVKKDRRELTSEAVMRSTKGLTRQADSP